MHLGVVAVLTEAARPDCLRDAWTRVLANDRADGILTDAVQRFTANADHELADIAGQLGAGSYQPGPLTSVSIPKSDGGVRRLHIPTVRDRVVERAIADRLTTRLDPVFSPWSFAYRPGLGVRDAVRRLAWCREEGARSVVRTDVDDCFDSLDRADLLAELDAHVPNDPGLIELVDNLLERPRNDGGRWHRSARGAPQGGPLSPLLCNLYLHRLDLRLLARGIPAVRYADDLAIPVPDAATAARASHAAASIADDIGLRLDAKGDGIMSFNEGFAFLGEDFGPTYPSVGPHDDLAEPPRRALYVARDGATVRIERGQLVVSRDDDDLLAVPSSTVGSITLFGAVGLSAGARTHALANAIDVTFVSRRGRLLGWLNGATQPNALTRRSQFRRGDDPAFQLVMARHFVRGKLANLRALLLRYGNRDHSRDVIDAAEQIAACRADAAEATDIPTLLGFEGLASRTYFGVLGHLLPSTATFTKRTRNPPTDPVNGALSFGYTILSSAAVGAIGSAGLDPVAGFLHADEANRPSLALDLIEEFRPLVVDTVVLGLFRRRGLTDNDFRHEESSGAVLLTEAGRRTFLAALEERFLEVFAHVPSGTRTSYRRALYLQARQIATAVRTGEPTYEAVSWR